jgi:hypothetical protein
MKLINRILVDSSHSRSSDEQKLKQCILLLRKAPSARKAVLEIMTKCIETNIRRLPIFKKNLEELRSQRGDYNNKGDEIALKQTLSDLNSLIGESASYWSIELAIWAISTIAGLGKLLGSHYPKTSLIETTQFWMDQEVTCKLSHIIVSGILYGLDNNDKIMEILIQQAYDQSPYLDWILACISISKPKVILTKMLETGFSTFVKQKDDKREHLISAKALTCILEYLVEKKPELVGSCLFGILDIKDKTLFLKSLYILELLKFSLSFKKVGLIYKIGNDTRLD